MQCAWRQRPLVSSTISRSSLQLANLIQEQAELVRQVTGEGHYLPSSWMKKLQECRMQEVSFKSRQSLPPSRKSDSSRCAIEGVANNGMFDRAQMYPNLMSSTRLDREL